MFRAGMLLALSTGHKIGLALTGAVFIVFSLISAMVVPRFSPNFPGPRARNIYIVVCIGFFAAMMAAVVVFGREKKKAEAATKGAVPAATAPAAPSGNPTAGKAVFTANGCGACHTFTPAGSKATVGPDLDKLADYAKQAKQPLVQFTETSITDPNAYIQPGFPKGVMPGTFGTSLSKTQLGDLVAFLAKGP
jgi:cytochrome c551/c552